MERHLLVTVSEKHDNLFGVRFLGNFFSKKEEIKVTLLYLTPKPPGRFGADPEMAVIMLTGHGSEVAAKEGLKHGAFDYLTKPCDLEDLVEKIQQAMQ